MLRNSDKLKKGGWIKEGQCEQCQETLTVLEALLVRVLRGNRGHSVIRIIWRMLIRGDLWKDDLRRWAECRETMTLSCSWRRGGEAGRLRETRDQSCVGRAWENRPSGRGCGQRGTTLQEEVKGKNGIILQATLCCNPELLSRDIIQASGLLIVSLLWWLTR